MSNVINKLIFHSSLFSSTNNVLFFINSLTCLNIWNKYGNNSLIEVVIKFAIAIISSYENFLFLFIISIHQVCLHCLFSTPVQLTWFPSHLLPVFCHRSLWLPFSLIYSPFVPRPVTIVIISSVKGLTAMMVGLHALSGNRLPSSKCSTENKTSEHTKDTF